MDFPLNDKASRKEFYEQFLTQEILESVVYKKFIENAQIQDYFSSYDAMYLFKYLQPLAREETEIQSNYYKPIF